MFINGRHVTDVVAGIRVIAGAGSGSYPGAIGSDRPCSKAGDPLVLHHLELAGGQGRLAEDLPEDFEDGGEVGAPGLDR